MIKRTIGAIAVAAALFASPAYAQDHAVREGTHAEMMRRELGLNAEQAARLEAIHAQLRASHREHCRQLATADAQQKQAMHARMRESMQRAHQEAAAVLTAEQRTRMEAMHAAHHGGAQAGGHGEHAMNHGQHGAQAGGHAQHAAGHGRHGAQGGHDHRDCCDSAECCANGTCPEEAHAAGQHGAQRRQGAQTQQHGAHGGHHNH